MGDCLVRRITLGSILGLYPLDARSTAPPSSSNYDNKKMSPDTVKHLLGDKITPG